MGLHVRISRSGSISRTPWFLSFIRYRFYSKMNRGDHKHHFFAPGEGRIMPESSDPKTYQLRILVRRAVVIPVGKRGSFEFPAGEYIYTGSAKKNIESRIARHLSKTKNLRWHIDYLLSAPGVEIIGVNLSEKPECALNRKISGEIIVPRFGATDCRNGCGSHLKFIGISSKSLNSTEIPDCPSV
jgi:Uri superfamily endonuclease